MFNQPEVKTMGTSDSVLMIGSVWPEPDSSAAGRRITKLIALFRSEGWPVTLASTAAESEYMAEPEELDVGKVNIEVNSPSFDILVNELRPSIVLFDRFVTEEQFGWRVAQNVPEALRILDTEDLHSLRRARSRAVHEGRAFNEEELLEEETAFREVASIYRSDLSLIISEAEMQLLQRLFGIDDRLLYYLPFMEQEIDEKVRNAWPAFEERAHFYTIGNFNHDPNRDAVNCLKREVWPRIREQLPEAELHVYGAYAGREMRDLHKPEEGFYLEGRADDAEEVARKSRVCLAPLRFGAGLKGKLFEAMRCGTPSVTTVIGAEGINGEMEWCGYLAGDMGDFADRAVELYSDKAKWEKAGEQGMHIINKRFANKGYAKNLTDRIAAVQANLEEHRRQNFMGRMLQHHTLASTEYMSRWIEAKNRNRDGRE